MTDARIPERFLVDRRVLALTADAWRSYSMSTLWSVSNRTDGRILSADLGLIPGFSPNSIVVLVKAGLWRREGDGWVDTEFERCQTSKEQLDHLDESRRKAREKKANDRARRARHDAGDHSLCTANSCSEITPSTVPGDVARDGPGDDTGQARTGQDRKREVPGGGGNSVNSPPQLDFDPDADPAFDPATGELLDLPGNVTDSVPVAVPGGRDTVANPSDALASSREHDANYWPVAEIPQEPERLACLVCGAALWAPDSRELGICGKTDDEHKAARERRSAA